MYSDKLTEHDVRTAFYDARQVDGQDIWPVDIRTFRPRSYGRRNGIEFYAESLHGKMATGHRPIGSYPLSLELGSDVPRAASWSAYGYVIARLFAMDPDARIGGYDGVAGFAKAVRSYVPRGQHTRFLELVEKEVST
jgi:hypothetical protein